MTLVDEIWALGFRGIDPQTQRPCVYVLRKMFYNGFKPVTGWKLVNFDGQWRNMGFFGSDGQFHRAPEKRGVHLSNNRIDTILGQVAVAA